MPTVSPASRPRVRRASRSVRWRRRRGRRRPHPRRKCATRAVRRSTCRPGRCILRPGLRGARRRQAGLARARARSWQEWVSGLASALRMATSLRVDRGLHHHDLATSREAHCAAGRGDFFCQPHRVGVPRLGAVFGTTRPSDGLVALGRGRFQHLAQFFDVLAQVPCTTVPEGVGPPASGAQPAGCSLRNK